MKIQTTHTTLLFCFLAFNFFIDVDVYCQETNSHISGAVTSQKKELLTNATVTAVHEPTKNSYLTKTNAAGYFYFFNLRPGGPYTLTISHAGYETLVEANQNYQYSQSQNDNFFEYTLNEKSITLPEATVNSKKNTIPRLGTETNISQRQLLSLSSISRNLQDYIGAGYRDR